MSFDHSLSLLKKVSVIQRLILSLENDNLEEAIETISHSTFTENQLITNFYTIGKVKTKHIPLLCTLLAEISKRSPQFKKLNSTFFTQTLLRPKSKAIPLINYPFIRSLYDSGAISYQQIEHFIKFYKQPKDPEVVSLFQIFNLEIKEKLDNKAYNKLKDKSLTTIIDNYSQYQIALKDELLHEYIMYGYSKDSIEYALKYDDFDILQMKALDEQFNWLGTTEYSYYEPTCLQPLTYLQFAAFFGSVNCFKMIVLNQSLLNNFINLWKYAIIGNNLEIVRMVEKSKDELKPRGILVAIQYFSNDIYHWILQTKFTESQVSKNLIKYYDEAVKSLNAEIIVEFINDGFTINDSMLDKINLLIGDQAVYLLTCNNDDDLSDDLEIFGSSEKESTYSDSLSYSSTEEEYE